MKRVNPDDIAAAIGSPWARVAVVPRTGSTNADLLADRDAPDRSVLVAEHQSAGRGRLDRTWSAPPGTALTFSVLLRPAAAVSTWGWLPLLAGVALHEAVVARTGVTAGLKWPNDLLGGPDERKLAGILAQASGPAVVIGIGLNVSLTAADLPVPTATSLALCGVEANALDRAALLAAILGRLDVWLRAWEGAGGDGRRGGLAEAYRAACWTLGRAVSVATIAGGTVTGVASGIDATGRLVIDTGSGDPVAVAAGDVVHLR